MLNNSIELKYCPMCGKRARLKRKSKTIIKGETLRNTFVYCPSCDVRGPRVLYRDFDNYNLAETKAADLWNKRYDR